jgi:hypothetical protein
VAFARPVQGQNLEDPTDPKHGLDLKTMATDFAKAYARGKTEGKELGTEGPPLSLGDVIIGFQDSHWPSALVLPQGPPARHTHQGSVSFRMDELPLPMASAEQLS